MVMGRHKKIVENPEQTDTPIEEEAKTDNPETHEGLETEENLIEEKPASPKEKIVKEKIKPAPKKLKQKQKTVSLNGEAFARFSVGIERVSLQFHKDKELKNHEEILIDTSARQLAELYEVPKVMVLIQYGASMILPHAVRLMNAHAEKIELQNEEKKLDIQRKKEEIQKGREGSLMDLKKIQEEIG